MDKESKNETVQNSRRQKKRSSSNKRDSSRCNLAQINPKNNARKPKSSAKKGSKVKTETEKLKEMKYSRGEPIDKNYVKAKGKKTKIDQKEKNVDYALEQSVKSELLLTEESGFMEVEGGETSEVTQLDILDVVDPSSATKRFDLMLREYGPYRMKYSRNGRYLLLAGRRGHVATMDWVSKSLLCEMNVNAAAYDAVWLHQETLLAVAQKNWLYVYDNEGIELHCIREISDGMRVEFLPYHFLLCVTSANGWMSWLDVTTGTIVSQIRVARATPATVAQHPGNALICTGHPSGFINFWSPNSKRPAVTKWCHRQPLCAIGFHPKGEVLATASVDRMVKLWDARNLKGPMKQYRMNSAPDWITFSQTGFLGLGLGNNAEIYKDVTVGGETVKKLYLTYELSSPIRNMEFCPMEDVLGIGHGRGFSSILVPGSGEANFDALEANPFQTKSQRQEREVHDILSKIPAELIAWDPNELRKVHVPSLEKGIEEKNKVGYVKPSDIHIEPRYKTGKKGKATGVAKRKKIMKEQLRMRKIKYLKEVRAQEALAREAEEARKAEIRKNRVGPMKRGSSYRKILSPVESKKKKVKKCCSYSKYTEK